MRLLEYQGRKVLKSSGAELPDGEVAETPMEASRIAEKIGGKAVIKAQIPVGGRGKAGGIKIAENPDQAEEYASDLLSSEIKGERVEKVLVVEAVDIENEYYLSVILDRAEKKPVIMFSTEGGVDIEQVAEETPSAIHKVHVDPLLGVQPYQIRGLLYEAEIEDDLFKPLYGTIKNLYEGFEEYGATLMEINPLALTGEGEFSILDSKVIIDDESKSRKEIEKMFSGDTGAARETELEERASEEGLQYVELDGDIGIIGNGAGLVMSTLDVVSEKGGRPANFLDVGGGADAETMEKSIRLVTSKDEVKGLFVNIFGGITRCEEIAKGLVEALGDVEELPLVVRLTGTNEKEGREILREHGIESAESLEDGAGKIVSITEG